MPNLTSVGISSGVPNSGTGTVSTIDALMAIVGEVQASPTSNTALDRLKTLAGLITQLGEVQASPTSNTVLDRLKTLAGLITQLGEVQASPTSNTVLDRLKTIATAVAAATPAGSAIIGKVTTDQTTHGTTDLVAADVTKIGGTAVDGNSGNKSAGTLRVVLATDQPALTNKLLVTPDSVALPANQSTNVNQLAGTTTDTNSGNKSAGTLRVVLATDQPALTNKLLVTPDAGATVVSIAATSGGATPGYLASSAANTNSTSLKGSAGMVYGIQAFNTSAVTIWLKLYNKASTPTVGTDTPVKKIGIPPSAGGAVGGDVMTFPVGIAFGTGIAYALTTGFADSDTGAVGAGDVSLGIDYK